ncbi:hypothetical protein D9Q98_007156 [Chlorella vulgaris]|uniref:E2 ubiquitin-conjugating enzyme n=1 Tax=Chlorella vulgaris TaxID=3077 RepID=A0A9D4YV05_CHLVU|nr:hypothetical protein D9Q98_007156 [Chlorella vulgaris]
MAGPLVSRMTKEIRMLQNDPPPGVWAAAKGDKLTELEAQLQGPKDTVYEGGLFSLSVDIPARYPFEPPKVKFVTPVYHPNIDPEGRICLDILNMPPKGAWKPSLNLPTILASIGLLLAQPNPDDGLVTDITAEFRHQRQVFDAKARQWTQRHATQAARSEDADAAAAAAAAGAAGAVGCTGGVHRSMSARAATGQQQQQAKQQQQEQHDPQRQAQGLLKTTTAAAAAAGDTAGAAANATGSREKENSQPGLSQGSAASTAKRQEAGVAAEQAETLPAVAEPAPKRSRLALKK